MQGYVLIPSRLYVYMCVGMQGPAKYTITLNRSCFRQNHYLPSRQFVR